MWKYAICIAYFLASSLAFDPSTYANSKVIVEDLYNIYWNVDEDHSVFYLAFQAKTTGWVGFGIGETQSGSMPGADIVVGTVIDGVGNITDRYSTAFSLPSLDCVQDWKLVAAEESKDGWSTFEVKRLLDTGDSQDRPIVSGLTRIIVAWGNSDTLSYHSSNRTTSAAAFIGSETMYDIKLPDDARYVDIVNNYTLPSPNKGTLYICTAFAVPTDRDYHIIRSDPVVDSRNDHMVHHFSVHSCFDTPKGYVSKFLNKPGECMPPTGNPASGCSGIIAAWSKGGGPQWTPPEAGFPMGPRPQSTQYIVLEMHYNDVTKKGGMHDNSGMKIWYTPTLRPYDASVMLLGDGYQSLPFLPPNVVREYESECSSKCTSTWPTDLHVFGGLPHMHQNGSKIWMTHWRNGVQLDQISRIEYWSVDHQQIHQMNTIIKPGDHLNLHCVFDTTGRTTRTEFGFATHEEMCIHFLMYYPRIMDPRYGQYSFCGSYTSPTKHMGTLTYDFCGPQNSIEKIKYSTNNPAHPDPAGGVNATFPGKACS